MWDQLTCVHQQSSMYLSGRVEEGRSRKGPSLSLHRLSGNCEDGAKKKHGPKWRYDGRGHDWTRTEEEEEEKYSSHNLI